MRKKIDSIHVRSFKSEVIKLVKKHGKVVVVFGGCGDLRRRMIKEDGSCEVSYKYYGKHRWSRYEKSCFMHYVEDQVSGGYEDWSGRYIRRSVKKGKKMTLRNTLTALVNHDGQSIVPFEIRYGRGLKKSIYVRGHF